MAPGLSLSKAGLLKLGEESGGLEENLERLGRHFETEHKRMLWVKKKMSYPMMTVIAGIFIAPFPTLFFGDAVQYFTTVGVELVLAIAFGGALLRFVARRYRNHPKVVLARLLRALAIAVESGLPMEACDGLLLAPTGPLSDVDRSLMPLFRIS